MGGASKAGLELGGFSSTGVFVEDLIPGSEAEVKGQLRKGDQLLEINGTKIGTPLSMDSVETHSECSCYCYFFRKHGQF